MITTTWRDTVAVLEMNRPERRNALSSELCRALLVGLDEAEAAGARGRLRGRSRSGAARKWR